ncbi:polysaccharide pyruvyl transferase family protein [Salinimicrobium sp. TH3]|uniref:polysaccharide pyruvyl transferase family protein n=1 Tax=Salinimicrobium sp. TH3 TaxID=2997342 RepID=UPI002275D151|nr:polysaccharide pyruvyl transferase family protein [Salinimicrobium sp. TH3]MCY2686949.1 polysaccharide pyruvyl transferase family protein [Salinimicrobium sp. TH3]
MRLQYYRKPNFGDALNPKIFKRLLPDFFDDDPEHDFFGIGSIIGLPMVKKANKKIIFSSGFAYGKLPQLDSSYDVICVRGPLSAKALNIDKQLGIADGALLLREFQYGKVEKEYDFSFMPHWDSENRYPWDELCKEAGIHYVSPTSEPEFVIQEILKSKFVVAEAMHYAIVADTLRVPWIPVKSYSSINDFKWQDWTSSLDMKYDPISLAALYSPETVKGFLKRRSPVNLPEPLYDLAGTARAGYESLGLKAKAIKGLKKAKETPPQLSKELIFNSKVDQLLERLAFVKNKYK